MVDMFQIPEDRFEEFLIDLRQWHKIGGAFNNLAQSIGKAVGETLPDEYMVMRWIDDSKHGGDIKISIHATEDSKQSESQANTSLKSKLAQGSKSNNKEDV